MTRRGNWRMKADNPEMKPMLREMMMSRKRLLVSRERRLSVRFQVANQQRMEKGSMMLVRRMFSTVEGNWLQIGIWK